MPLQYLKDIDHTLPQFGDLYDELPLWSARFGVMLLDRVEMRPGVTILDAGAGTGFLTIELAQRCGPGATVIAVDPWEAAMTRLACKVDRLGLRNVRLLVQDVAAVDLPGASVDLVVSNLGINNFDDPDAALRACHRFAKPGAGLVLTTNVIGHMAEFYEVYRDVLEGMGFADRLPVLDAHINHRATVDSLRLRLERSGFTFVDAVNQSFRERFVDGSSLLRHHFIRLGFVPGWKAVAPPDAVEATFAALEERLNAVAARRGGLELTVPAGCVRARKPIDA
jgi:ubiquinone/menaquinone biosynthesis C-methylase UbiE